jgi:hypothetical protein
MGALVVSTGDGFAVELHEGVDAGIPTGSPGSKGASDGVECCCVLFCCT